MGKNMKTVPLLIVLSVLTACATRPPAPISRIPATHVSVAEVQAQPQGFTGAEVRWGGLISKVENKAQQTWIEVVSLELKKDGEPRLNGPSEGRFIATISGFADPQVYKEGYLLTVVGNIAGHITRPIDEFEYTFPLVTVSGSYLWKVEEKPPYQAYPPPWRYYDPWPMFIYPYPHHHFPHSPK